MAHVDHVPALLPAQRLNVSDRLSAFAEIMPDAVAVACPSRQRSKKWRSQRGKSGRTYATITFGELEKLVWEFARGLTTWGVPQGTRLALLVTPGIEFV